MVFLPKSHWIAQPPTPKTEAECLALCGIAPEREREEYWDKHSGEHGDFLIAGAKDTPQKVQLWRIFRDVLGFDPDLTPQPTGNCVAAAADDGIEFLQSAQIGLGKAEEFKPIYNPFHYATGRVLIGKNKLRGGAGSVGGWQAKAIEKYGVLRADIDNLPKYNKNNCDNWGDDRSASGQSFRDHTEEAQDHIIKTTARVKTLDQVTQSIANLYPVTIAASFGYQMKSRDPKGTMRQGKSWGHQMLVYGFDYKAGTVELKNQWGDVHGQLIDPDDGVKLPLGFIRTTMEIFERHLQRAEAISYSDFDGYPERRYDFRNWA